MTEKLRQIGLVMEPRTSYPSMPEVRTKSYECMRNETEHGVAVRRVADRLNGGLSPATEAYLAEVGSIYKAAAEKEIEIAQGEMRFDPSGLYTPESIENLTRLKRHTSVGSRIWVLQPGISVDVIQAGYMRVAGREGKDMLNWLSAASSLNLGGQHPDIETADSWAGLRFGSNNCSAYHPMGIEDEAKQTLVEATPGDPNSQFVVWESTGGGANTVAMEAAIIHQQKHGRTERRNIVAFKRAYHGNNGPAGMATDFGIRDKYSFLDRTPTIILPFPDTPEKTDEFIDRYTSLLRGDQVAGILLEAIQGDGGMRIMTQEAADAITTLNEQHDVLSIWDEIQSGMGRSGKFLAVEWFGQEVTESPINCFTLAKALANGYPISAAILPKRFDNFDTAGALTTMMGNPSGLVRMMTAIEIIDQPDFLKAVEIKGQMALDRLNSASSQDSHLRGGRGRGLMLGAEFTRPGMIYEQEGSSEVTRAICYLGGCGVLAGGVGNNGLRLHPRLTVEPEVVDAVIDKVIDTARLMDEGALPAEVDKMVEAGKSALDF